MLGASEVPSFPSQRSLAIPDVRIRVRTAEGTGVAGALVKARAIGAGNEPVYQNGGGTIVSEVVEHADDTGLVTLSLPANSTLIPDNSFFRLEVKGPADRKAKVAYIQVPNGAGPYDVEDVLHEPGTVDEAALAAHIATIKTHADWSDTSPSAGQVPIWDGTNWTPGDTVATDIEANALVVAHSALTTGVHGVGASTVESVSGAQTKATAAQAAAEATAAAALSAGLATKQPLDDDLTTIAGLDSATAGALTTDGAGWIRKTYAQLKTALGLVKADVGLGNVDNTADADKPVSTAQATAIGVVQTDVDTHEARTDNPHAVTKAQVGLSNVTNDAQETPEGAQAKVDALSERVFEGELVSNVKDYGAVGDGVADDTAAIQLALDTAHAARTTVSGSPLLGPTVFLPPGNYRITSKLTWQSCSIQGANDRATVITWDGNETDPVIESPTLIHKHLTDVHFRGGTPIAWLKVTGSTDWGGQLRRCSFNQLNSDGVACVWLAEITNAHFENLRFDPGYGYCVRIDHVNSPYRSFRINGFTVDAQGPGLEGIVLLNVGGDSSSCIVDLSTGRVESGNNEWASDAALVVIGETTASTAGVIPAYVHLQDLACQIGATQPTGIAVVRQNLAGTTSGSQVLIENCQFNGLTAVTAGSWEASVAPIMPSGNTAQLMAFGRMVSGATQLNLVDLGSRSKRRLITKNEMAGDGATTVTIGSVPNSVQTFSCANAASQGVVGEFQMPTDARASSPLLCVIHWSPSITEDATAARWSLNFLKAVAGDLLDAAGTTTAFTGAAASKTANAAIQEASTQVLASVSAGDIIRFNVRRLGSDAADSFTGAARIHGIELLYTAER